METSQTCAAYAGDPSTAAAGHVGLDPSADRLDDVVTFGLVKLAASLELVPFLQTTAAACGGGMLGDEHGMPAVRRLPAVLLGSRGSEALVNEILGMPADRRHAAQVHDCPIPPAHVEPRPERLPGDPCEARVKLAPIR